MCGWQFGINYVFCWICMKYLLLWMLFIIYIVNYNYNFIYMYNYYKKICRIPLQPNPHFFKFDESAVSQHCTPVFPHPNPCFLGGKGTILSNIFPQSCFYFSIDANGGSMAFIIILYVWDIYVGANFFLKWNVFLVDLKCAILTLGLLGLI